MKLTVNNRVRDIPANWQNESLLFVMREYLGLTGAKFGCGVGQCGACTVIIDGQAQRSCITNVSDATDSKITTIEGLATVDGKLHPVQKAWIDEAVPQCGYCQAGQIMSAVALIETNPNPDEDAIEDAMEGVLCRCGTYRRIRKAIDRAAENTA